MVCTMRRQDMPWAYITNESTIRLKTEEISLSVIWLLSGPVYCEWEVESGNGGDTGGGSQKQDLEVFSHLLLTLGRYQKDNKGSIAVCPADQDISPGKSECDKHRDTGKNYIAKQQNNQMYFKFSLRDKRFFRMKKCS